ncbi:MAG: S1/P1 nuclease [Terriglobales bacterium]
MRRLAIHGTLVALLLLTAAPRAWAWGCAGHQIVAYLAWAHLRPQVRARAERLLAGMPLDQAACWADTVRTAATAPWHFVQLPLNARPDAADYARYCNHDCLTWALLRFETQLGPGPSAQRTTALYYVIHLTGDATQPLHASDDDDNGGNCVRTRLPGARRASNLHADWDTQLLRPLLAQGGPAAYAATLDRRFGRRYARTGTQPAAWVWQAHALAVRDAYGPLHIAPGCKTTPIHLSAAYVRQADRDITIQLDRAGWRLAAVLNHLLEKP